MKRHLVFPGQMFLLSQMSRAAVREMYTKLTGLEYSGALANALAAALTVQMGAEAQRGGHVHSQSQNQEQSPGLTGVVPSSSRYYVNEKRAGLGTLSRSHCSKWWSRDLNPGLTPLKAMVFSPPLDVKVQRHPRQDTDTHPYCYLHSCVSIPMLLPLTSFEPTAPPGNSCSSHTVPDRSASLTHHSEWNRHMLECCLCARHGAHRT